jgi:ABC-2 type transport system ATP-binding protein
MIQVDRLTFDYPTTRALHGVTFHLPPGSITALVGPNGAGKTTLLRCLAALEEPVDGTVRVGGVDALADPRACHREVGYLSDFFGLYDDLSVAQCLRHAAAIRGVPPEREREVVERAAARLGIADRLGSRAGELSRGLRQRLAIAQAILHEPRVLLLDEPASGLDPEARHQLATLFLQLRDEGMTLLVSSHILAELDAYSTDMLVLREGRIVSHEPVAGASGRGPSTRIALVLARPFEGLGAALAALEGVSEVRLEAGGATFAAPADAGAQARILAALVAAGVPVSAFAPERRSMQDAYLATVGERRQGVAP